MRIISGERKGLALTNIHGNWIRPTTDKIRGAIFSSLHNYFSSINGFIDCFGGSGAMAIEAASRKIKNIYCFDNNKKSIKVIKENLNKAHYNKEIHLYNLSAKKGLEILKTRKFQADVFFMDPPYKDIDLVYELLEIIKSNKLIAPVGLIVIEHDKSDIIQLNDSYNIIKEKKYGNTIVTYLELK